jgi:hypothetical protein
LEPAKAPVRLEHFFVLLPYAVPPVAAGGTYKTLIAPVELTHAWSVVPLGGPGTAADAPVARTVAAAIATAKGSPRQ